MNFKALGLIITFVGALTGLVGCRSTIEGKLNVVKNFNGKVTVSQPCNGEGGGDCFTERTVQIKQGQYTANVHSNSKTEVEIEIKGSSTQNLKVNIPRNMTIPANGEFSISAAQSGQPFNIVGAMKTAQERSKTYRERESCWVERWDVECYVTGNPPQQVCREVRRTFPGYKNVEYYYLDTVEDLLVDLKDRENNDALAQFTGHKESREKRYSYEAQCW